MNRLVFVIKNAIEDFRRNKVRTFLTSLGILIGVASVVLLMAFGLGLRKYIQDQFNSLGTNLLRIVPGQLLQNGSFRTSAGAVGNIRFDEKDLTTLRRLNDAQYVMPVFTKSVAAAAGGQSESGDLYGSSADIFTALNLKAKYGELFTKDDVSNRTKVVTLGPKIATKIFGAAEDAVGKNIKVDDQSFKIVGVLEAKGGGGFGGPDLDSFIYMPYTTAYVFNPQKNFYAVIVKTHDNVSLDTVREEITKSLTRRYKADDFSVIKQEELLSAISSIFGVINTVLVAIATISLIVGGIGIMNIMYVSVVERIREIGIRRALGATRGDILSQFLAESVILSLLGGFLGLALSYLVVLLIQQAFPAYIDLMSIAIALGVSSAIGITFGFFPARKAANLSPIEAIRYE